MHPRDPIEFASIANLANRLEEFEAKVSRWLDQRRKYTTAPLPPVDTSASPTEPLNAGLVRTLAREVA
jgi:hypothetical protein